VGLDFLYERVRVRKYMSNDGMGRSDMNYIEGGI
jgi:hypothetical protein